MNLSITDMQRITILHSPMRTDCKLFLIALVQAGPDVDQNMLKAMASLTDEDFNDVLEALEDDGVLEYNAGLWCVDWDAIAALPAEPQIIVNNRPYTQLSPQLIIDTWHQINGGSGDD